jgi:hypothetical protein
VGHGPAPRFWPPIVAVACGDGVERLRIEAWVAMSPCGGFSLVSVYAFDPVRREVVVVWPATVGSLSHTVAPVATTVSDGDAGSMCAALTRLSDALWDVYVRPASAAVDEQERGRREDERQQFDGVVAAVREPNLPDQSGSLMVSYSPVEESAHRLGRVLHKISLAALVDAVVADVAVELDAVARAELGDLSGRAVQAVVLDRLDVSPIQVVAADELLRADPLGGQLLGAAVDPAAACVAAAHWLAAAAIVAADESGGSPGGVFAVADDIQPASIEVPSLVVERIVDDEEPPRAVVLGLLRAAVAAAGGEIADLAGVLAERARLEELVQRLPADKRAAALASEPVRATLLDPRRPARDLLEHLLDGINSCWLLYDEYADDEASDLDDDHDNDELDIDGREGGDVLDADVQRRRAMAEEFAEEFAEVVREQAAADRGRLI